MSTSLPHAPTKARSHPAECSAQVWHAPWGAVLPAQVCELGMLWGMLQIVMLWRLCNLQVRPKDL